MKNPIKTLILACALALAACSPGPEDPGSGVEKISQALTTYTNPYTGYLVTMGLGRQSAASTVTTLIWWQNYNCTVVTLNSPGFAMTDTTIDASNALGLEAAVLGWGQTKGFQCNNLGVTYWLVAPAAMGSATITVQGTPAADYFNCSGDGQLGAHLNCNGNNGNDIMDTWDDPNASNYITLHGNAGNDTLTWRSTGNPQGIYYGDDGDDCVRSAGGQDVFFTPWHGNLGTDKTTATTGFQMSDSFESWSLSFSGCSSVP